MVKINGVGVIGYGGYVPRFRIKTSEIARTWDRDGEELPVKEKSVAGIDEDTTTMAIEAAKYALKRAGIDPRRIGAVHVGSESPPYAVKPSGTIVAEAIGCSSHILSADLEFACKAGTEAMQMVIAMAESGMVEYGLSIGADTAQARPGDLLEYTASSGAAAFIIGKDRGDALAMFESSVTFVTDTPDFWRRRDKPYPVHTNRFTGDPAYFRHTLSAAKEILSENGYKISDFDYAVFHQPNVKFPLASARVLGIPLSKVEPGMLADKIGNTYAACSMLGLVCVFDMAKPGQRILMTSFGSGAGSDAFVLRVTDRIEEARNLAPAVSSIIDRRTYIDYGQYVKTRKKLLT